MFSFLYLYIFKIHVNHSIDWDCFIKVKQTTYPMVATGHICDERFSILMVKCRSVSQVRHLCKIISIACHRNNVIYTYLILFHVYFVKTQTKRKLSEKQMGFLKQRKKSDIRYGRDTINWVVFFINFNSISSVVWYKEKKIKRNEFKFCVGCAGELYQLSIDRSQSRDQHRDFWPTWILIS